MRLHAQLRGRRGDRVAAGVPGDRRHPPRDRRAALGSRRAARRTSASGCRSRSSPTRGRDPAAQAELADSLSMAFLVVLESLTPEQRAVFLLREVFDYPYDRIAEIVGRSEDASRQLAVARPAAGRARASRGSRPRPSRRSGSRAEFFAAVERRRPRVARARAGGRRRAARRRRRQGAGAGAADQRARPARRGRSSAWSKVSSASAAIEIHRAVVNGQPGATMSLHDGAVDQRDGARDRRRPGARRALDRQPGEARAPRPAGRRAGAGQPASAAALKPASASSISLWRTLSRTAPRASIESIRPGSRAVE